MNKKKQINEDLKSTFTGVHGTTVYDVTYTDKFDKTNKTLQAKGIDNLITLLDSFKGMPHVDKNSIKISNSVEEGHEEEARKMQELAGISYNNPKTN